MGGYAVLQVLKPDLLTTLNGAVTSGHNSFVLQTVLGLGVNDLLTFDTGGSQEVLKIATINTGTNTVTTTTNSANNHADKSQVLRVGGITNALGTPNLLSDLSASASGMRLAAWSDLQQGGCGPAAFQLYSTYETTQNTVYGNGVLWSCLGGALQTSATAGAASVVVSNLLNQQFQPTYTQIPSAWNTTLNPADVGSPMTLSGGNLVATIGATGGFRSGRSFASMSSGRWYWEVTVTNIGSGGALECMIGIGTASAILGNYVGSDASGWAYDSTGGRKQHGGTASSYGASYTTGDIIGIALDLIAGTITFYKNGVSQGVAFTGLSGTFFPMVSGGQNAVMTCNFAGPFVYTPPIGYLAKVVDIIAGDTIVVTDGTNTELFAASTVTDNLDGTWTIALGAAGSGLTQTTLTNSYATASTSVTRLQWQGYIESRNRVTRADNVFTLNCVGYFNRYGFLLGNSTIEASDAAASILAIAQSYSNTLTSVYVNSSNFIAGPTQNVTVKNAKDTQIASLFSTILQQESASSTSFFYAMWVDAMKALHHASVATVGASTSTYNVGAGAPTQTLTLGSGNPSNIYGDHIGDVDTTDMDGTSIANALVVTGGQNPTDSSQVRILVEQSDSITQFGWLESAISNGDITNPDALAAWAGMKLALMAFPAETTKVQLDNASGRINGRDLVKISGFTDASTRTLNVLDAQYQYDPATMNISGTLDLGAIAPTSGSVTKEIAAEYSQVGGTNVPKVNLGQTYVVSGLTYSTAGNVITFQPGVICYQGVTYNIAGGSLTAANGDTTYRASSATLSVVEASSRTWNGRKVYATKAYTIASKNATPSLAINDDGILLCRVQCVSGTITGVLVLGASGGIGGNNLKPPTNATLSVASYTPTITAEGAASAKLSFTATLTNLPIDDTIKSVDVSYRTAGGSATDWHPWVPCVFNPASTAISGTVHGIPAGGGGFDVAVQARGQNGAPLGAPVLLAPSPTVTAASVAAALAVWNDFGATVNADGSWSNADGASSSTHYPISLGSTITAQANIAKGGTAAAAIGIGNTTNGYLFYYDGAGGVYLQKYVSGVATTIGSTASKTNDTNYHALKLTISVLGASNNLIQASWDGVDPNSASNPGGLVDTAINLTTGTWPVTLYTGGNTGKVTGYAANTALDHYVKLAPIVKKRIGGDGTLDISTTAGPIVNTLPLVNHASPVQAQLNPTAGSDGSYLAGGSVSNRHVQAQSVAGTQTLPTRYSTQQTNASYGGVAWATAPTGGSAVTPNSTLTNGQIIYYNTGSGSFGGSGLPVQTAYNVPASGSITCLFTHNAFISGGNGLPRVYFSGSTAGGGTTTLQTAGASGTSAGSASGASYGSPLPTAHYSQANGAPATFNSPTSVSVSGSNPISLNLTSVTCPSDSDGGVTLTVTLKNPAGTVVQTWTGITSSASFPLSYSTAGASGTWVWSVQAIAFNNNVSSDIPYSTSYTASFSGTVSYWQTTGASGNTYVLASDGTTQRINALDGNVAFTQIAPDTIAFKVFNSAASALSFSIGVDVGGV